MTIKPGNSLSSLSVDFATDAACRQALEELRWPEGLKCLRCGSDKISRIATRKQYDCNKCRYRFSVTTGTVFNHSHLALPKWFIAVFLACESREGVSANHIRRTLGLAQKTAWHLCHRIRQAMSEVNPPGTGRGNHRQFKQMVLGAVERHDRLRMSAGLDNAKVSLHGTFHQVSRKHLDRYLDEFESRYNNRKNADLFRDTLQRLVQGEALPYQQLTAQRQPNSSGSSADFNTCQ